MEMKRYVHPMVERGSPYIYIGFTKRRYFRFFVSGKVHISSGPDLGLPHYAFYK